jgi:LuxR family maltose regulon positive regulatory protein
MQASGRSGYSDPEIYKHVMLSRMFQMEADWDSAAREMRNATDLARAIPPAMVREHLISQQIRVDLAFQRLEAAQALLQAEGFDFNGAFQYPDLPAGSAVTDPLGLLYNSALRILLFQGRLDQDPQPLRQGIALASRVLDGELQCGHLPVALETLLLRGQMHAACGNDRDRLADVAQAVQLAEPEGFISIFVEEGQPIAEALTSLLTHHLPGNVPVGYLHDLLAAFPSTPSSTALPGHPPAHAPYPLDPSTVPIEPLTPRELEVLQLIAAGDSNQTIAGRLVITLSAVKKHAGNIFNKLNVDSRTQAISRARQLGLLAPDG